MSEVLKEQGDLRVILELEQGPPEPYNDGQSPLLRIDPDRPSWCKHIPDSLSRPYGDDQLIENAVRHWGGPWQVGWKFTEKYLRMFFGVTQIETYFSDTYWYVTYDSAKWREYAGTEPGSASLDEWKAWIEGEVYGYAIQRRVTWNAVNPIADKFAVRQTWEDTEDGALGGFYGYDCARERALAAFEDALQPQPCGLDECDCAEATS